MHTVIDLVNVTKSYGTARGVKDVNLVLSQGEIMGFLGPNGSGKTTTISMLAGLTRPSSGAIKLFGEEYGPENLLARSRIGFLSADTAFDRGLTGMQQLEYFGNLRGSFDKKYVEELGHRLQCDLHRKFRALSKGNKQKVGLVAALMNKPELLILDEPTTGLDPLIQAEFNKIILEHKQAGGTVFISSHVLSEIQELCDRVVFIREGKVIADKLLAEITDLAPKRVAVRLKKGSPTTTTKGLAGVAVVRVEDGLITFTYRGDQAALLKKLASLQIDDVTISDADLETIFMEYYEEDDAK